MQLLGLSGEKHRQDPKLLPERRPSLEEPLASATALSKLQAKPTASTVNGTLVSQGAALYVIQKAMEDGLTLREACKSEDGLPAVETIYKWAIRDPQVGAALAQYRQVRAYALDEEVERIADFLTDLKRPLDATQVRRLEIATKSKQWLAAHRFPQVFGTNQSTAPTITLTINSNLDFNDGDEAAPGIFSIRAEVPTPMKDITPTAAEAPEDDEST